jgi:hypothetical protein
MIEQKILDAVQIELQNLAIKKLWKINYKGVKVKVRRSGETAFEVYHNGHFVATDLHWKTVFELVKILLESP